MRQINSLRRSALCMFTTGGCFALQQYSTATVNINTWTVCLKCLEGSTWV